MNHCSSLLPVIFFHCTTLNYFSFQSLSWTLYCWHYFNLYLLHSITLCLLYPIMTPNRLLPFIPLVTMVGTTTLAPQMKTQPEILVEAQLGLACTPCCTWVHSDSQPTDKSVGNLFPGDIPCLLGDFACECTRTIFLLRRFSSRRISSTRSFGSGLGKMWS